MNKEVLSWDALEYHHTERSSDWYWTVGIITVSLATLCIIFGNILLGVFLILAAVTGGMYANRKPDFVQVKLLPKGVFIHDRLYKYEDLDSFWIDEEDFPAQILLKSKKFLMPYIHVPFGYVVDGEHIMGVDPEHVREYLLMYINEEKHEESIGHRLLEYIGF